MKYRNTEHHLGLSCCNRVCRYNETQNVGW